jgi:shikimate kinase
MKNIVLTGMPGSGKSTTGVVLAKTLGRTFTDTDLVIQERTGRLLQEIIDTDGPEAFLAIEEEAVLSLERRNAVIATGGSVVLSPRAMGHLRESGIIVYLAISLPEMLRRLGNTSTRGIVLFPGQSLRALYAERVPLYERYAEITVDAEQQDFENRVGTILYELAQRHIPE